MSSAEIQPRGPENRVIMVGNPNVGWFSTFVLSTRSSRTWLPVMRVRLASERSMPQPPGPRK